MTLPFKSSSSDTTDHCFFIHPEIYKLLRKNNHSIVERVDSWIPYLFVRWSLFILNFLSLFLEFAADLLNLRYFIESSLFPLESLSCFNRSSVILYRLIVKGHLLLDHMIYLFLFKRLVFI